MQNHHHYDTLRKQLVIDKHALDEEVANQAFLYQQVSEGAACAQERVDRLKDKLRRVEAEVQLETRRAYDAKGAKYTETGILSVVQSDPDRTAVAEELTTISRELAQWQAMKDSFTQRSFMIRELAQLLVAGYYTANTVKLSEEATHTINRQKIQQARESLT